MFYARSILICLPVSVCASGYYYMNICALKDIVRVYRTCGICIMNLSVFIIIVITIELFGVLALCWWKRNIIINEIMNCGWMRTGRWLLLMNTARCVYPCRKIVPLLSYMRLVNWVFFSLLICNGCGLMRRFLSNSAWSSFTCGLSSRII